MESVATSTMDVPASPVATLPVVSYDPVLAPPANASPTEAIVVTEPIMSETQSNSRQRAFAVTLIIIIIIGLIIAIVALACQPKFPTNTHLLSAPASSDAHAESSASPDPASESLSLSSLTSKAATTDPTVKSKGVIVQQQVSTPSTNSSTTHSDSADSKRYIVLLKPNLNKSPLDLRTIEQSLNVAPQVHYQELINGFVCDLTPQQHDRIQTSPHVDEIVPDILIKTMHVGDPVVLNTLQCDCNSLVANGLCVPRVLAGTDASTPIVDEPIVIRQGPVTIIDRRAKPKPKATSIATLSPPAESKYPVQPVQAQPTQPPQPSQQARQHTNTTASAPTADSMFTIKAQSIPWGINRIHACANPLHGCDGVPSSTIQRSAVQVYVVDTGIDLNHKDLRVVYAKSFVPTEKTAQDMNGHGTHVAGTIGARDNTVGVPGVCPDVALCAIKALDGRGSGYLSWILGALNHVLIRKRASPSTPMVMNMSLGATVGTPAYNAMDVAVRSLVQAGVVCCVAAGNESAPARLCSPAHTIEAITVGAYDSTNKFASFSNYDSTVDILAPGVNIISTFPGNRYASMSGTSMATPHVAGACALYLVANPRATPTQVQSALNSMSTNGSNPLITSVPAQTTRVSLYV